MQELDVAKYLKKKKSSTSKSENKSKHKHEYKECLLISEERPYPAKICKLCNKIRDIQYFVTERTSNGYRVLHASEIFERYKDVEHIDWKE